MLSVSFVFESYIAKKLSDGHFTIVVLRQPYFDFYMVYTAVLNSSYEIKCFIFSCCFQVAIWVDGGGGRGPNF